MQIILKEDVQGLGYKDDVVEVKNGYGRNYLIPQGKAVIATPSALKVLAENQRQRAHKLAKIKADAEAHNRRQDQRNRYNLRFGQRYPDLRSSRKTRSQCGSPSDRDQRRSQGSRQIQCHNQLSQRSVG